MPDRHLAEYPRLLDRRPLELHYSPSLLWSDQARTAYVPPDLRPIPPAARAEAPPERGR